MTNDSLEQAAKTLYERDGGRPELWENIGDELRQKYRDGAANPPTRVTNISIGKTSTLLAEQRFYDNTFLRGDDDGSVVLFIYDAVLVRGPSGRETLRTERDVIEFPYDEAMVTAIMEGGWAEAPLEKDRQWKPDRSQLIPVGADQGGEDEDPDRG